jgi:hypothetical protein
MSSTESVTPLLPSWEQSVADKSFLDDSLVASRDHNIQKRGRALAWHIITLILATWGTISLGIALVSVAEQDNHVQTPDVYRPWTLAKGSNNCDCGTNIDEAIAKDCTYDALAAAWLPPHCRDDDLTAQFSSAGPGPDGTWFYYADSTGTTQINESQIASLGDGSFWVHRDWHLMHCVFYWQKYMRMRITGVTMEARFDNIPHIRHCGHLLTKTPPKEQILIKVDVVLNSRLTLKQEEHDGTVGSSTGQDVHGTPGHE